VALFVQNLANAISLPPPLCRDYRWGNNMLSIMASRMREGSETADTQHIPRAGLIY
jgi:hypothetical protein